VDTLIWADSETVRWKVRESERCRGGRCGGRERDGRCYRTDQKEGEDDDEIAQLGREGSWMDGIEARVDALGTRGRA